VKKIISYIILFFILFLSFFTILIPQENTQKQNVETINANFNSDARIVSKEKPEVQFLNKSPNLDKIIGFGNANKVKFSKKENKFAISTSIGLELYSYTEGSGGNSTYSGSINYSLIKRYITNGAVNDFCFNKDGNKIAVALSTGEIHEINITDHSSKMIGTHGDNATAITYTKNNTIITGGSDFFVRVWEGNKSWILAKHKDIVTSIDSSPDGVYVASGSRDTNVMYSAIDTATSKVIYNHDNWVNGVMFTLDGKYLISIGSDNLINRYNLTNDQIVYRGIHTSWVNGMDLTSDGKFVVTGSDDSLIYSWEYAVWGDNKFTKLGIYSGAINSISLSRDNKWVAFTSEGKEVAFANISSAMTKGGNDTLSAAATKIQYYTDEIYTMETSPNCKYAVAGYPDGNVLLWDLEAGKYANITSHIGIVYSVAISNDLSKIASTGSDGVVKVWFQSTGNIKEMKQSGTEIYSITFSPDSKQIIAGGMQYIYVWNLETDAQSIIDLATKTSINTLKYSKDGTVLVAGLNDGSIIQIDPVSLKLTLLGKTISPISKIDFSTDNNFIFTSSPDGNLRQWNLKTKSIGIVASKNQNITDFKYDNYDSNKKSFIVIGLQNALIGINIRKPLITDYVISKHKGYVSSVKVGRNNYTIYSSGDDGVIKVNDLRKRSYYHNNTFFNLTLDINKTKERLAWKNDLKATDKIYNYAIQDKENIYFLSNKKDLKAFSKETGKILWEKTLNNIVEVTPVIVGDNIIMSNNVGKFLIIDKKKGNISEIDLIQSAALSQNQSYYVDGNNVYFCLSGAENIFYGIDIASKKIFLQYSFENNSVNTVAGDTDGIYFIDETGNIFFFKRNKTTPEWVKRIEGLFRKIRPIIEGNKIIVASVPSEKAFIVALDKNSGNELWRSTGDFKGTDKWPVKDNSGYGYFFDEKGILKVKLIDGTNQRLITLEKANITSNANFIIDGNYLYLSGIANYIMSVYNINTGALEWNFTLEGSKSSFIPLIDNDRRLIYAISDKSDAFSIICLNQDLGGMVEEVLKEEEIQGGQ